MMANQQACAELKPDKADIEAYTKVHPEEAARLRTQNMTGNLYVGAQTIGLLGSGAFIWRKTKFLPYLMAAPFVALACGGIVEDVTSLATGSWKWDNLGTFEKFYAWLRTEREKSA